MASMVSGSSQHHWGLWCQVCSLKPVATLSSDHDVAIHCHNPNHKQKTGFSCPLKPHLGLKQDFTNCVLNLLVNKMCFMVSSSPLLKTSNVFIFSFGVESHFSHKMVWKQHRGGKQTENKWKWPPCLSESGVQLRWWTWRKKLSDGDCLPCHSCEDPLEPGSLLLPTTSGSKTSCGPWSGRRHKRLNILEHNHKGSSFMSGTV